ncbi:hypothetical protein LQM11_004397 [Vibrio parahaemolyticus]|nr:hypothetical protein [Vibrio parahaemolyticus]
MALESCIECHRDISDECEKCPHCGKPEPTKSYQQIQAVIKYNQRAGQRMLRLFGFGIAFVGGAILWIYFAH